MKRLVALLLALLLPICVLAESVEVTIQVKASDALFSKLSSQSSLDLTGFNAASLEKYASLLKALLKDVSIIVVSQENAYSVDFALSGVKLLDMTAYMSGSLTQLTSSLIPGYVLEETTRKENSLGDLRSERQKKIAADVKAAYENWRAGLNPVTTTGVFVGDAYTGGTKCTTWSITDRDVAALLSAVMTPEMRALIQHETTEATEGKKDVLEAFDAANDRVLEENKYSYLVRSVKDDRDEFVGLSVSVFEKDMQLATMSVGAQGNDLRLVVGLGLKQQNYWTEWHFTKSQREGTAFIKGEMREWTAGKNESFTYVRGTNAPAASYLLNCSTTDSAQRMLWDGHVYKGSKADAEKEILSFSGVTNQTDDLFEASVRLMESKQTLMSFTMTKNPAGAIQPPEASLTRCSAEDPAQKELYTKVRQTFVFAITVRLLQVIPIDVLLMMEDLFE